MSGNKSDILELIDPVSRPKVERLIELMKAHRPHVDIDRGFQRELKSELMDQIRSRSFSWQSLLSPLSLLATSFLVIMAVWKVWWIPTDLGPTSPKPQNIKNTPLLETPSDARDSDMSLTSESFSSQGDRTDGDELVSVAKISTAGNISKNPPVPAGGIETSRPETNVTGRQTMTPTDTRETDIDITGDIASIATDIESIAKESVPIPSADSPIEPPADAMMLSTSLSSLDTAPSIILDYPDVLAVYTSMDSWTKETILSLSGTGVTSKKFKTLSRTEIEKILSSAGGVGETAIEYKLGKRGSDTTPYLIPTLRFITADGTIGYTSLIEGYTLD